LAENRYGANSRLRLSMRLARGQTILSDTSFTAPFKITAPFYDEKNRAVVMILSVSAGLLSGDRQEMALTAEPGARCVITSQSFEKIHKMDEGFASRRTKIFVGAGAELIYAPLPVIPFAGSAFVGETTVALADETARLCYADVLACGRASRGERFVFREYRMVTRMYEGDTLIYADNAAYLPDEWQPDGLCGFEGFTHTGGLLLVNYAITDNQYERVRLSVYRLRDGVGGVTRTGHGDVCVRALANGSEPLLCLLEEIKEIVGI
jgi:urease accessory protein